MRGFDIYPFCLPHRETGEARFEEPRDIKSLLVEFKNKAPEKIALFYLRKTWPQVRIEKQPDLDNPCGFGWIPHDDWFNGQWQKAKIKITPVSTRKVSIAFFPLSREFPEMRNVYDVLFRRTLGLKLEIPDPDSIKKISVFTDSPQSRTTLNIHLDSGKKTPTRQIRLEGYNALVEKLIPLKGVKCKDLIATLQKGKNRSFLVYLSHIIPSHKYANDEGLLTFHLDRDAFTISLESLKQEGPVWFEEKGIFISNNDDQTTFSDYRKNCESLETINQKVRKHPEQSFAGAFHGQPRAHSVSYNLACKHARQRFWLESNGDILLFKPNVTRVPGKDTPLYKNDGSARFFFGLEKWASIARFPDPSPILSYNLHFRKNNLLLKHKSFAVPLSSPDFKAELNGDDPIIALVRFRFYNQGDKTETARLSLRYSQDSRRSFNPLACNEEQDDHLVPVSPSDKLTIKNCGIWSPWKGEKILRCHFQSNMKAKSESGKILFEKKLAPHEACDLILEIPFISLEKPGEKLQLAKIAFDDSYRALSDFWRNEGKKGAQIQTPEPHLNALHSFHLTHVLVTDFKMPDGGGLINTSVGTSTYGNFTNESCMITQELDQRGLHDEARRRLELWIKYQGTVEQPGNFTDHDGLFFGAAGFEEGAYNQHHGWALWRLCDHFFITRDRKWMHKVADAVIAGAYWVFRQRKNTMKTLPHSRGWEYGFLPAGSLEDVTDFHYWLSTNSLTWRGTEWAARALEAIDHPEASRIRKESDAYRKDLIRGFETMRQYSPLVRLRNGRWIPHYPSRLYRRGRDIGWIRETLEGAIYLLISGLYDVDSQSARWILDDYNDNRYVKPPYGYLIPDFEANWYDRAGFSIQPNLLAGLLPHLDRDEPEIFLWMFFNAWSACYREEIGAMVEHPAPALGYSNSAHFKTSDQANAIMWLRYMFVYSKGDLLHIGRAIPREWFCENQDISLRNVFTHFGRISVIYQPMLEKKGIEAKIKLDLFQNPGKILVRFRLPENIRIDFVKVNGKSHKAFDPIKKDVDITGFRGKIDLEIGCK
ncbi:hypothetical protein JW926_00010 [Candidatus Sumerlaeota bacterium]|nr:hypothetical protein [Candidatus Sumerlaeota bacterium]